MPKYTAKGLPVVSRRTIQEYKRDIRMSSPEDLEHFDPLRNLKSEQPELHAYLCEVRDFRRGHNIPSDIASSAGVAYDLLRTQVYKNARRAKK